MTPLALAPDTARTERALRPTTRRRETHLPRRVSCNAHRLRDWLLISRQKSCELVKAVGKSGKVGAHGHHAVCQRLHQDERVRLGNARRKDGDVAARKDELEQRVGETAEEVHSLRKLIRLPPAHRGRCVKDRGGIDRIELGGSGFGEGGEFFPRPGLFVPREAPTIGDEPVIERTVPRIDRVHERFETLF